MNRILIQAPKRLFLAAALAGLGTVALAQSPSPAPAPAASAPVKAAQRQHPHMTPAEWHERMAQRHAQQLAKLKTALGITSEQESAWSQFEAAMQPPPPPERPQLGEWAKLTTPERIDRMEQRAAEQQQRMKEHGDAVKAFYAQLTPAQQKTFDGYAAHFAMAHAAHMKAWAARHDDGPSRQRMRHRPPAKPAAAASQAN